MSTDPTRPDRPDDRIWPDHDDTRDDVAGLADALAAPAGADDVDVDAGWARLSRTVAAEAADAPVASVTPLGARAGTTRRPSRLRRALRRPALVAAGVAVVVAGASTAAATNWVQIFRAEQVAPVTFSSTDLMAVPDPTSFGDVVAADELDVQPAADAAAAQAATGLDVPTVAELPDGVTGDPTFQVAGEGGMTFVFSAATAEQSAAAAGEQLPPLPAGLDGTQVRLSVGPGLMATWASNSGVPALVVGRAVAPTATSTGASFATVRDYVLSMPGVPADVAQQLRTFDLSGSQGGSTLPIPVPTDQASTSTADVDGAQATVVRSIDGTYAAVVWVSDGVVTAVAGTLDADELLDVARGLS